MCDTMTNLELIDEAERNDDGDLVVKREGRFGNEHDVNVSKLFRPGKRTKASVQWLVTEARLHHEQDGGLDNPAFPANGDVADKVLEQLEDEPYDPAWLSGPAERGDL